MKKIILLALCMFPLWSHAQTNYYVSPSGNNSNSGSLALPWQTIQYGLNHLASGDTLNVMSGTYTEKLKIPISNVTLRNASGASPIVDANGITSQTAILQIVNKSNVTVSGLELQNSIMTDAQGILVDGNCQHITISGCIVHDIHFSSNPNATVNSNTNAQGIIVYGSNATTAISNLLITGNELYNCRLGYSEGIAVNGNVDGFEVSYNLVHDLTNIGIDAIGHEGTSSNTSTDQARNGVIKHNTIHHCVSPYATSGGLYVDGGKTIVIENNTSYHNGYGLEVGCENVGTTTDGIIVRNNIFYDNEVAGVALGGYDYPSGSGKVINSSIFNNTFYSNDYSHSGNGELYLSYSEGSNLQNNIFYLSTDNNLVYAELTQPTLQFDYNLFYCSAGASSFSADWNGSSYGSFNSFKTGTGSNSHSTFANPLFVSAGISTPDFHLTASSPAIDKGNPSYSAASSETDMDGQQRVASIIDCGADEYYLVTAIQNASMDTEWKLYPNPAREKVTIAFATEQAYRVSLYDVAGVSVYSSDGSEAESLVIYTSTLQPGIYLVLVTTDDGKQTSQHLLVE